MISDAYATPEEYRARLMPDADNGGDVEIGEDLTAVSRYLEGKLGRCFNKDTADVARTYVVARGATWTYASTLAVDDLADDPTSIQLDANADGVWEITLGVGDYELLPLNATAGPEARPYTAIRLLPWATTRREFTHDTRVKVTAKWGWPAVPAAIKIAAIQLAGILRLESPRATRRIPEGMDMAIETSPDAQYLLRNLIDLYSTRWVLV